MNKKRIISISTLIAVVAIVIGIVYKTKEAVNHTKVIKKQDDMMSMMLETAANSGKYEVSTLSSFPTDGYIFNSNLSSCENGGKLIWDDANNYVVMKGNVSDKCYLYFDKYELAKINDASATANGNKIDMSITAQAGTGAIAKYFYSKDDGASYVESATANYTFTGLSKGKYKIKMYVEDVNGKKSDVVSKTVEITVIPLSGYVISQYNETQGNNGIYYHTSSLANSAADNSYRYSGANPNNYICLGSSATTCPDANLYRIIGVFESNNHGLSGQQLVKVVGSGKTYNSKQWNASASNTFSSSTLKSYLDTAILSGQTLYDVANIMATATWKVGGYNTAAVASKAFYTQEVTNSTTTASRKVGLMYVSDYGFAASPSYWGTNLTAYSSGAAATDWLNLSSYQEWVLTPDTNLTKYAWYINTDGNIGEWNVTEQYFIRFSFYLVSSVNYEKGTGTASDPIRVS